MFANSHISQKKEGFAIGKNDNRLVEIEPTDYKTADEVVDTLITYAPALLPYPGNFAPDEMLGWAYMEEYIGPEGIYDLIFNECDGQIFDLICLLIANRVGILPSADIAAARANKYIRTINLGLVWKGLALRYGEQTNLPQESQKKRRASRKRRIKPALEASLL